MSISAGESDVLERCFRTFTEKANAKEGMSRIQRIIQLAESTNGATEKKWVSTIPPGKVGVHDSARFRDSGEGKREKKKWVSTLSRFRSRDAEAGSTVQNEPNRAWTIQGIRLFQPGDICANTFPLYRTVKSPIGSELTARTEPLKTSDSLPRCFRANPAAAV
jgi:hypothetical protein